MPDAPLRRFAIVVDDELRDVRRNVEHKKYPRTSIRQQRRQPHVGCSKIPGKIWWGEKFRSTSSYRLLHWSNFHCFEDRCQPAAEYWHSQEMRPDLWIFIFLWNGKEFLYCEAWQPSFLHDDCTAQYHSDRCRIRRPKLIEDGVERWLKFWPTWRNVGKVLTIFQTCLNRNFSFCHSASLVNNRSFEAK